jgi:hypothetical protein
MWTIRIVARESTSAVELSYRLALAASAGDERAYRVRSRSHPRIAGVIAGRIVPPAERRQHIVERARRIYR